MSMMVALPGNAHNVISFVWRLCRYVLTFLWLLSQPKVVLAAKVLALQRQLMTASHTLLVPDHRIAAHPGLRSRIQRAFYHGSAPAATTSSTVQGPTSVSHSS